MYIKCIGIDLAKHVFQLHGVDEHEKVVLRRQLRRSQMCAYFAQLPPTLIGMEACGSPFFNPTLLTVASEKDFSMDFPIEGVRLYDPGKARDLPTYADNLQNSLDQYNTVQDSTNLGALISSTSDFNTKISSMSNQP